MNKYFPFSAIVGQEQMKLALILTAIDPSIGGVLVFGDRGTGKSTIVRSLAGLLPKQNFVIDCSFNCQNSFNLCDQCKKKKSLEFEERSTPVIDLPLGSTEDRVVGALNLEIALTEGRKVFEPGLLAKANSGFLYIDEVNLLEDHIVDLLLDVAASGENLVERERRDEFERDPQTFLRKWRRKDLTVQKKIIHAKNTLDNIKLDDSILSKCAEICIAVGSDGLRGELTLLRALRALCAFNETTKPTLEDIREIAVYTLSHRLRRDPLDDTSSEVRVKRKVNELIDGK